MSDTFVPKRSIWTTPLRDLVRGRVTGRLDWPARLAVSGLPPAVQALVVTVVRRTRLWRLEKAAVAEELIAHFADAAEAGVDAETMIAGFGDAHLAAKLIRRAKKRDRPLLWRVRSVVLRSVLVLAVLYGGLLTWFLTRRATISVDYFARINASETAVPQADRAWPLYRRAILGLELNESRHAKTLRRTVDEAADPESEDRVDVLSLTTNAREWPAMTAWLDAHAEGLRLLREAAAKPTFGFVYGRDASARDPELGWPVDRNPGFAHLENALISTPMPVINPVCEMAEILAADLRRARARNDAGGVLAGLDALLGLARQQHGPFILNQLVAFGIYSQAFEEIERLLAEQPELLSDAELIALAHRMASVGGDTPASWVDIAGERLSFYDLLQRTYSDDGHGGGTLTRDGVRALANMASGQSSLPPKSAIDVAIVSAFAGTNAVVSSRRDVHEEYDRLMDLQDAQFARPQRELTGPDTPGSRSARRLDEIKKSPLLAMRYLPVVLMVADFNRLAPEAERLMGTRDGLTVGLALEFYRRRNGHFPASLAELAPALLPRVPTDRMVDAPVWYHLFDGRPVVYSVGVDGDNDGGRTPDNVKDRNRTAPTISWKYAGGSNAEAVDGDWVLYDGRPHHPPTTRPQGQLPEL